MIYFLLGCFCLSVLTLMTWKTRSTTTQNDAKQKKKLQETNNNNNSSNTPPLQQWNNSDHVVEHSDQEQSGDMKRNPGDDEEEDSTPQQTTTVASHDSCDVTKPPRSPVVLEGERINAVVPTAADDGDDDVFKELSPHTVIVRREPKMVKNFLQKSLTLPRKKKSYHPNEEEEKLQRRRSFKLETSGGDHVDESRNSVATCSGKCDFYGTPRKDVMTSDEAEMKRSLLMSYLQRKFPQHAQAIAGISPNRKPKVSPRSAIEESEAEDQFTSSTSGFGRIRSSYASTSSGGFTSSEPSTRGFSRGGALRSSLPIVRTKSRSHEAPLGVVFLEFCGEIKTALLPNELTSLDTIRALFVHSYQGLLTMPMLDPQRHTIMLKNRKNGHFEDIENVERIKNNSVLRIRQTTSSGIPMPGSKKSNITSPSALKHHNGHSKTTTATASEKSQLKPKSTSAVDTRNLKNTQQQQRSKLKESTTPTAASNNSKSRISFNSLPRPVTKRATAGSEDRSSRLQVKDTKKKVPPPIPTKSKPSSRADKSSASSTDEQSLHSGNGHGGGSIPHRGFSYISNGVTDARGLKLPVSRLAKSASPSQTRAGAEKNTKDTPTTTSSSVGVARPKTLLPSSGSSFGHHQALASPDTVKSPRGGGNLRMVRKIPTTSSTLTPGSPAPSSVTSSDLASSAGQKRSTSPPTNVTTTEESHRIATIHASGGSAGYCRAGRSLRGNHQLKAVGIPQVPAMHGTAKTKHDVTSKPPPTASKVETPSPPEVTESSTITSPNASMPSPIANTSTSTTPTSTAKSQRSGKKGTRLFGLKRFVGSRSSSTSSPANSKADAPKLPEKPSPQVKTSTPKLQLEKQQSPQPTSAPTSRLPGNTASKLSPMHARRALIPKSNLVNSLLSTKTDKNKTTLLAPDIEIPSSSDEDRLPPGPLTGVLKYAGSNIMKSSSSSSFVSDSSNMSARIKKVSFQNDITICDEDGISTYCNGLERGSKSTTSKSAPPLPQQPPNGVPPSYEHHQSLSSDTCGDESDDDDESTMTASTIVQKQPDNNRHKRELEWTGPMDHHPPYYECCIITDVTDKMQKQQLKKAAEETIQTPDDAKEGFPPFPPPPEEVEKDDDVTDVSAFQVVIGSPGDGDDAVNSSLEVAVDEDLLEETLKEELPNHKGESKKNEEEKPKSTAVTTTESAAVTTTESAAELKLKWYKEQLEKVQGIALKLKEECGELKRQQHTNMEEMRVMMTEKSLLISKQISRHSSSRSDQHHRPLRIRRFHLDTQRHEYGKKAANTENQLAQLEAAVEELRNEVVVRRCRVRVNSREVEALALQLSQTGRMIASMKNSFPAFSVELKSVGLCESEVICSEKNFLDHEPIRLDEQLKRCQQLTSTLFTLKKLAQIHERDTKNERSPPSAAGSFNHPHHPQQDDPTMYRQHLLSDIQRIPVDHVRRMESIQALEMAEKVLRRTDHLEVIEQRQQETLKQMYANRHNEEKEQVATHNNNNTTNLTASESSSLDSLPPPPPPMEQQLDPVAPPPPNVDSTPVVITPPASYVQHQWDQGSPRLHESLMQRGYTGSLPRRATQRSQLYQNVVSHHQASDQQQQRCYGRETPIHLMERSQSAVPFLHQRKYQQQQQQQQLQQQQLQQQQIQQQQQQQYQQQWIPGYHVALPGDVIDINEEERRRMMMVYDQQQQQQQQHFSHLNDVNQIDKNRRLQEQYMKLQRLQFQRIQQGNNVNSKKPPVMKSNIPQAAVYVAAKSSNV